MKKYHLIKFFKLQFSFIDILDFFRGNFRYYFYYTKGWKWMIRPHIRQQIDYRINVMDKICYNQGYCKECGCATTNLQMANKPCEGKCYPPMLSKGKWVLWQSWLPEDDKEMRDYIHEQMARSCGKKK